MRPPSRQGVRPRLTMDARVTLEVQCNLSAGVVSQWPCDAGDRATKGGNARGKRSVITFHATPRPHAREYGPKRGSQTRSAPENITVLV